MSIPGPDRCKITKAEDGYVIDFNYTPQGRKTPVKVTKIASDEFELKAVLREVYG